MKPTRWMIWIAVLAKSLKLAKLAKLAKVFKALKAVKLLTAFGSMILSVFVYSFIFGPWFAVGFVLLLFVHEMGHVIALRIKGYPLSAPVFIPMFGAVIFAPKFTDRETEAFVGYGGPLLGSIGAVIVFALWAVLPAHPEILLVLSFTALFLNLFNLIPIRPFDGGRITQAASELFGLLGAAVLIWLPIALGDPSMLLFWILILTELKFNSKLKLVLGIICVGCMIAMMIAGLSPQHPAMDCLDVIVALSLVAILWLYVYRPPRCEEVTATLPPLPIMAKLKWSGLYIVLAGAIIGLMLWHVPYLPAKLIHSSDTTVAGLK